MTIEDEPGVMNVGDCPVCGEWIDEDAAETCGIGPVTPSCGRVVHSGCGMYGFHGFRCDECQRKVDTGQVASG